MSYCIYLFHDRIIAWMPLTSNSNPPHVPALTWYILNMQPPLPLNDIVLKENMSYNFQQGFFTLDEALPPNWEKRHNLVKQIHILGKLKTIANTQRSRYTDNAVGQPLADQLLLDEIREYRATGNFENCTILQSLLATTESDMTPEGLVTKLWLKYESYRNVTSYLRHLEHDVRQMFEADNYEGATELLDYEIEKMRV